MHNFFTLDKALDNIMFDFPYFEKMFNKSYFDSNNDIENNYI